MESRTDQASGQRTSTTFSRMSEPVLVKHDDNSCLHTICFADETVILSVNGGYLAAASLRTIEALSDFHPVNCATQFLKPVTAGDAELKTKALRQSSRTGLFEVHLFQSKKLAAITHIWASKDAPSHDNQYVEMPAVPHPEEMQSIEGYIAKTMPRMPFWDIFEQRHIGFLDMGQRRNSAPRSLRWMRYRGLPDTCSTTLRASLALPIVDVVGLPAAMNHSELKKKIKPSPTIQLAVHFHDTQEATGWLLGEARAEMSVAGVLNCHINVWSQNGTLVAQGLAQMFAKTGCD